VGFKCSLKIGDGHAKISALRGEDTDTQFPDVFF
jgi:hypothetical protein